MENNIKELEEMINKIGADFCIDSEHDNYILINIMSCYNRKVRFNLFFDKHSTNEYMMKYIETIILIGTKYFCEYMLEVDSEKENVVEIVINHLWGEDDCFITFDFGHYDYSDNGIEILEGEFKGNSYFDKYDFNNREFIYEYSIDTYAGNVDILHSDGCVYNIPVEHTKAIKFGFSLARLDSLYENLYEL